jgi:TldD protein
LKGVLFSALDAAQKLGARYVDIRSQCFDVAAIAVVSGDVQESATYMESGLGARALAESSWGFASSTRIKERDAIKTAEFATRGAKIEDIANGADKKVDLAQVNTVEADIPLRAKIDPREIALEEKLNLVLALDRKIRRNPLIKSSIIRYQDRVVESFFCNTENSFVHQSGAYSSLSVKATARRGSTIRSYSKSFGATAGYEFYQNLDTDKIVDQIANTLRDSLDATTVKKGRYPVVLGNQMSGVFVHEAVGHLAEADFYDNKLSCFTGRMGEKVASETVSVVDDPSIENEYGSYKYDDEGVKGQKRRLIVDGVLLSLINNRETSAKLNMPPNGGFRAQSYRLYPLIRSSNTYIEPRDWDFDELISDIKLGIFVKDSSGGGADPSSGLYHFNAQQAALIERGEITKPLINVAVSGQILESLREIDGVGKDTVLNSGLCHKQGQYVPVCHGGPWVRLKRGLIN